MTRRTNRRKLGVPFALWAGVSTLSGPVVQFALRRRLRAGKELPDRLQERRGTELAPRPDGRLVWLHAASVGETLSLLPLLEELCRQQPGLHLLVTTGTVNAQRLLAERLVDLGLDGQVRHRFVPLDLPHWVGRFLDHWRPDVAVLVESELWPNLIAGCVGRAIPLALLNARMSERSARGWGRAHFIARRLFGAFDWISARSEQDAARLVALGARDVEHEGDLKQAAAALPFDETELARLQDLLGTRPLWLAASTHEGEEVRIGLLHRSLSAGHPDLLTVIAPRHPERGPAIAAALDDAPRRAAGQDPDPSSGIWICDTLGELGLLYRLAGIVLVGNSLQAVQPPGGGHNPLEPARLGCALVIGPKAQNFEEDVQRLVAAEALFVAGDEPALEAWLGRMLGDPGQARTMADAAVAVADASEGLPERLARRLLQLMADRAH